MYSAGVVLGLGFDQLHRLNSEQNTLVGRLKHIDENKGWKYG